MIGCSASGILKHVRVCLAVSALLALTACGGNTSVRFCTGGAGFCAALGSPNRSPTADAGPDQQVTAGDLVRLDGSGFDPDGHIESYAWVQTAGVPVTLTNPDRAEARFIAPAVEVEAVLRFELTVTDDKRASDRDSTEVSVLPGTAAALTIGLELLEKRVYPLELDGTTRCPAGPLNGQDETAFVGLWLLARTTAVERESDAVSASTLLDELRRLFPRMMVLDGAPWVTSLYRQGITASIRFAEQRDPALGAELADTLAVLPTATEDISALLVDGRLGVFRDAQGVLRAREQNPASLARLAVRLLIDSTCGEEVDAPLLAAATVALLADVVPAR